MLMQQEWQDRMELKDRYATESDKNDQDSGIAGEVAAWLKKNL